METSPKTNIPQYFCIDLKSFYASVECIDRGLDPLTTPLVVADPERSKGTICLAVSPALKAKGIRNRCRLFEIPSHISYITAIPRMQRYIDYAARIYGIYLEYFAQEDIHVYSIDEAFFDTTTYLSLYKCEPCELAQQLLYHVEKATGIPATVGIGTNLYLAKIALDITAKHNASHWACLDEESYCQTLWHHRPLSDFWRIGRRTARILATYGIHTMYDITTTPPELLRRLFGIDAELLLDHAWGRETTTMADIKNYHSHQHTLSSGQMLMRDYTFEEGKLIALEMMDLLCLDLTEQNLTTATVTLQVGYNHTSLQPPVYGSAAPETPANTAGVLLPLIERLYMQIVNPLYPIRRLTLTCQRLHPESYALSVLFEDVQAKKERTLQHTISTMKARFGKNAILKGLNLQQAATTRERNRQIGGHKSGE